MNSRQEALLSGKAQALEQTGTEGFLWIDSRERACLAAREREWTRVPVPGRQIEGKEKEGTAG